MEILHIDFETRSTVDLRKAGVGVYARHESTSVLCIGFAVDEDEVGIWRHTDPASELESLAAAVTNCKEIVAHNAAFEMAIWNDNFAPRYNLPPLPLKKVRCTMAQAYAMGIPGNLEGAAAAMGLEMQKDMTGSRIMKQLAKPRDIKDGKIIWWDVPERYEALYEYCKQDVRVERELDKRLMRLSESEQELWMLDQTINTRGIMVDMKAVNAANDIVDFEVSRLDSEMKSVTGNFVACCTEVGRIKEWLKVSGIETDTLSKDKVNELLERQDLTDNQRSVLRLRKEAGKTSTAKLVAFLNRSEEDSRIRGILQYHAAHTGRWGGRGIQPQNFPRPGISQDEIESIFKILDSDDSTQEKIEQIDMLHGQPITTISHCLRGFLIAKPGHEFIGADYSAIEGRVLAWLCGEEKVLELYRNGQDIYKWNAIPIFGLKSVEDVTDKQRFVGKVAELALGYGGGKGAFKVMAQGYGTKVSDDEAERIKTAWRSNRPCTVRYWWELEQQALAATLNPGQQFQAGPANRCVKFLKSGSFLFCQLPSKRVLTYPYPKVEEVETPWGETKDGLTYMAVSSYSRKWTREKTYGGKLSENVTQAVARDLLAHGLKLLEKEGYEVVMHVHDEVLIESPSERKVHVSEIEFMLSQIPEWAKDLPVDAEGWKGIRYQK